MLIGLCRGGCAMSGKVISVSFSEDELQVLDDFDNFFEARAERQGDSYSRSDEIRKAMVLYKQVMELIDELGYGIEDVRPQTDLVRQALLDLHRRDSELADNT